VLCEGLVHSDGALAVARRVQETATTTIHDGAPVGLSVGVAVTDGRNVDPDGLIAAADDAMYLAKELRAGSPILQSQPTIS
jgi:GGDEF domain-containing protein